ncbi:hypothetical protein HDV06_001656 [Boothiomyces sp. JEL0866]|nr:hypothetical protein HDV06_001656 [Boothiomyces sp. JEL0866]
MNRHILTLILASVVLADCSALYGQCGGQNWNGPTCCQAGSVCKYSSDWYSQCLPDPSLQNSGCSAMWGQCGGQNWNGPTCCQTGSTCQYSNDWYSQCLAPKQNPSPPAPKPNPPPAPKPNPPPPAPKPIPPPVVPAPPKPVVTPAPVNPIPQPVTPVNPPQPIIKIPAPVPSSPAVVGKNQNGDNSGSGNTNSPSQSTGNSGNTSGNSNSNNSNNSGNSNSNNSNNSGNTNSNPSTGNQSGSTNGIAVNPVDTSTSVLPIVNPGPTNVPTASEAGSSGSSVNVPLVAGLTLGIVVAGIVVAMFVSYKDRMLISDDDSILGYYNDLPPKPKALPLVESSLQSVQQRSLYSQTSHRITTVPSIPETLIAMPNQNRRLRDSMISIPNTDEIETPILSHNEVQPIPAASVQFNFPPPPADPTLNRVEQFVKNAQVNFPKSLYCKTKSSDALRNGKPQLLSSFQLVPIPNENK